LLIRVAQTCCSNGCHALQVTLHVSRNPRYRLAPLLATVYGDDMIVKSNEVQRRSFLGVDFVLLSHGPESMVTKMLYKKEDHPPLHKHANEGETKE
jgi:hypothetical protein